MLETDINITLEVMPFCFLHLFLGFTTSYQHVQKVVKICQSGVLGPDED